ncbi:hypothetical protein [Sporosarcina sp. FSL K6-2383]|uniref:hypothetical protein n=1 Tax=Sporosarcina sp. FSL K6-2383 TaxID=2921556 RepID=UPI003159A55F
MKKKYTFRHFMIVDGKRVEIDPTKVSRIADGCKLLWANISTGKEHVLVKKGK